MKLHLPKMLSTALLATFAAVAGTTQAAITMTDITQWDGYDEAAGVAHVGNNGGTLYDAKQQQSYKWNNYWNFIYTVDASTLTAGTYSLDTVALTQDGEGYIVASSLVMNSDGTGTVSHGGWNQTAKTAGINLTNAEDITFVLSRNNNNGIVSLAGYVDDNFDTAAFTLNVNTNLSFGKGNISTVSYGNTGGLNPYNYAANTYRQVADTSVGTFDITKAGYLLGSQVTAADLGKYYSPATTLVWNGTAPTATWDTTSESWLDGEQQTKYVSGYGTTANFNTGDVAKDVTVSGAIKAATVNVNDDYTFTVQSGSSLTADALNVAADKTATVAGEGTVSLGALSGALAIEAGATVNMDGTVTLSGTNTLQVSGKGTLGVTTLQVTGGTHTITNALNVTGGGDGKGSTNRSLGLAVTGGTVTLEGTTHISGAMYDSVGTVNIGNGTDAVRVTTNRLEFGDSGGSGTSTLNIKANATLHVKGGDVANSYANTALVMGEWNGVSVANISGKLYADNATAYVGDNTVTFNIEKGGLMAVKGFSQNQYKADKAETINLNLNGGKLVLGANGIASQKPINVSLAGGEVGISADSVTIAKDVTLSGNTSFNTVMYVWQGADDTRELVAGTTGGTLTITGNITGDGAVVKNGEGTLVLSGANNVLNRSILANAGSVTLRGGYEIGGINSSGGTEYADGEHEGNGYATATGDIKVYITRDTGTVDATNATFTYRGKDVTVTDGVYTLPGEQDTTTYFINEETDSYSWIDTHKKGELTGGIVVAEDATLRADKDMNMSLVAASSKGTVQIDSGVVVTAAGGTQTVTLAGSGAYALASGTAALGDVTMGEEWTGNVRISGANTSGDWNTLAREGSKLELYGVTGYAKQWAAEAEGYGSIDVDVVLTNDGDKAAFTATAGSAGTAFTTKFTKSVSGTGTFAASAKNASGGAIKENYEFSGDISGWTGEFLFVKGVDTKVTFSGDAKRINAKVNRNGGNLAMVVNTTQDAVFSQEVDVTATTLVRDDGCTQFTQAAKLGNLSGAGDIEANADLTIGGTSGYTGTIETDSGTSLTVAGAADLSGAKLSASGDVIVAEGASLTLTEGSTIKNVIQNSGTVTLTGLTLSTEYFTETQGSEGAHFGLDDQETTGDNYFTGTSASFVQVVDGGTSTGSALAWGDLTGQELTTDGKIITVEADIDYDTFYVGSEISTSAINASSHAGAIENIEVGDGATLTVNETLSQAAIHAGDGATVAGEHAQAVVQIRTGETLAYADGLKISDNDSAQFSGDVQVTNEGSENTFSMTNREMVVQAETLTYGEGATDMLQIVCGVDVANVTNQSGQELILNTLVASELDGVSALSGDIVLVSTQGDLTINNLVISAEQAVQAIEIVGGQTPEVTVTVTETLAAGGNATLLANLEMADDSALLLDGVQKGVSIGSVLTMNTNIMLDEATLRELDGMAIGETFWLVGAAEGTTMEYTGESGDDAWYASVFSRTAYDSGYELNGDFNIMFDETDGFGLKKFSNTPEPTTGTLSLLALAALAARRRRK